MGDFSLEVLKKSVILSPASCDGKSEEKGILTLQKEPNKVKGLLKCFHLNNIEGKLLLGLTFDDNVLHKFNLELSEAQSFYFTLPQNINLSQNISCVLVAMNEREHSPIIWGSSATNKVSKLEVLESMLEKNVPIVKASNVVEKEKPTTKKPIEINAQEDYIDEEVENLIDDMANEVEDELKRIELKKQLNDFKPYKNIFETQNEVNATSAYGSQKKQILQNEPPVEEKPEREREQTRNWFYDEVKDQIDALFEKYEAETALEEIIPNSRFVRVNFDAEGDSYIFGVIYDENQTPEYIVYGIPALEQKQTPQELEGYYQWLPLDPNNPEADGYFMMYQDAKTGEHVKIEII